MTTIQIQVKNEADIYFGITWEQLIIIDFQFATDDHDMIVKFCKALLKIDKYKNAVELRWNYLGLSQGNYITP